MEVTPRLHVDFNEMFEDETVDLRPAREDLARIQSILRDGLKVVLWDEDIDQDVPASLNYHSQYKMWVAIPDRPLL